MTDACHFQYKSKIFRFFLSHTLRIHPKPTLTVIPLQRQLEQLGSTRDTRLACQSKQQANKNLHRFNLSSARNKM